MSKEELLALEERLMKRIMAKVSSQGEGPGESSKATRKDGGERQRGMQKKKRVVYEPSRVVYNH